MTGVRGRLRVPSRRLEHTAPDVLNACGEHGEHAAQARTDRHSNSPARAKTTITWIKPSLDDLAQPKPGAELRSPGTALRC